MRVKSIKNIKKLRNRKVIVRVDFNVPIAENRVIDDLRIKAALPTIKYLSSKGAIVILLSHLEYFDGKKEVQAKLAPVARRLHALLEKTPLRSKSFPFRKSFTGQVAGQANKPCRFLYLKRTVGAIVDEALRKAKPGDIILLENVRLNKGEVENDSEFSKKIANLGDYFVNEAFSVSHRNHASISGIPKFLPSFAGLEFIKEIKYLGDLLENYEKPYVLVIGGAKISDKAGVIDNLGEKADFILCGGGVANTILMQKGYKLGKSLVDKKLDKKTKEIVRSYEKKIILPQDVVLSNKKKKVISKKVDKICESSQAIMDIGPKSIENYKNIIKTAKTIIWSGPFGKFEESFFGHGTAEIGQAIGSVGLTNSVAIVGGGDTVEAVHKFGLYGFDHISLGGGAMLRFLERDSFPGLEALIK